MSENTEQSRSINPVVFILLFIAAVALGAGSIYWFNSNESSSTSDHKSAEPTEPQPEAVPLVFSDLDEDASLEPGSPREQAIATSQLIFDSSPAAIYSAGDDTSVQTASQLAEELRLPVLIAPEGAETASEGETETEATEQAEASETTGDSAALSDPVAVEELNRLGVTQLVTVGTEAPAEFEGEVTEDAAELSEFEAPQSPESFVVLTDQPASPGLLNLMSVGGVIQESPSDPRQSSEVIAALADDPIVVSAFSDELPDFDWQLATARTGVELPGGGQLVFGNKRYIALYGSPATASLGVLGEQGVPETIARAQEMADQYQGLTDDTVIPSLEIIATVASGSAGDDGNYSNEWSIETLKPLVEAAEEAGQYVVIDFQPGRSDFLSQVQQYEELLMYPHVGIALDPEWRLGPDEEPLTRIGHVEINEVNEVASYLADFTREYNLPQKLVVLHQFQVQMLRDIDQLDQSRSEIVFLIHADGQGTQGAKQGTWTTLLGNAPNFEYWGWKNFYDEDSPMLTPEETFNIEPLPHFVSYQ